MSRSVRNVNTCSDGRSYDRCIDFRLIVRNQSNRKDQKVVSMTAKEIELEDFGEGARNPP